MGASIRYYSRLILGIIIMFQGRSVFAQRQAVPDYSFRRISMQDGLANQIITAAGEDQRGMLWFGTQSGLYRFDGFRVTHFSDRHKGFLPTENITDLECLAGASSPLLLVCTQGRGWLLDAEYDQILPFSTLGLPDSILTRCTQFEKKDKGKYVALCAGSLYQIEQVGPARFTAQLFANLQDSVSGVIVIDPAEPESVWLLPKVQEIYRVSKSECSRFKLPSFRQNPNPMPGLIGLVRTPNGLIGWDFVRNLCRFEPASKTFEPVSNLTLADIFPAISSLDRALNQRNVLRLHQVLQTGQELAGTTLGLFILQNRYNHFQVPEGMVGSEVRGILTDSSGNWLAGTYTGLFSGALSHKAIKPVSKIAGVWGGIPLDTSNWMLVCENKVGVFVLNRQNNTVRRPLGLSPYNMTGSTLSVCKDFQGNIWVGTYTSLYWSPPGDPFHFNVLNYPQGRIPIQAPFFRALLADRDSSIWAGAENGLFRLNLRKFPANWSIDTLLRDVFISDLYPDQHGNVWIASKGKGLARYNRASSSFEWFNTDHGLASNSTCRIEGSDKDKVLWISTHNGLSRLDVSSGIIHNYHEADGIPGNEFNSAASARFPNGVLMFGGVAGLVHFHPDSLHPRTFRYKTFFSHLHLQEKNNDSINLYPLPKGTLRLPPYPRLVEICLGFNDFVQPAKPRFRYRLAGAFESWTYTNGENKISLFNLSPGDYTLEVQALPYDGHQGKPVRMHIHVARPLSETWWFRALMLIGLVLISYLAYRYRLQQVLRTYAIRQQIADDLHDDIGNKLNMTNILLQKIKRDYFDKGQPPPREIWAGLLETNQQTLQSLRTLIWSVDPRKDRLENIFTRMQDFADDFLQPLNIQCRFSLPEQVPDKETLLDFRHNIIMIFQELLTNMVKHAPPRQVAVQLHLFAENTLTLTISNKFDEQTARHLHVASDKRGMTTLKRRLDRINGTIKLFKTTDTSQTITLSFSQMFK